MSVMHLTLDQIKTRGYAARMKELGPAGYVRFMQQFLPGKGDYTKERHESLDKLGLDDIQQQIEKMHADRPQPPARRQTRRKQG